ncbi:YncE family protein [bacterium]|nr:YncE family protein [bacterium]
MTREQLFITISIIAIVFAGAYFLTSERQKPLSEYIDRGNRHEVASSTSYETQKDEQGAVTVEVKPLELSPSATEWTFEVTLDTHSVELNDDMAASAFLADDKGKEYQAVAWEGDPPGGHHRKGTLKFNPLTPFPAFLVLKLRGVGEAAERMFLWNVNGGEASSESINEKVYVALEGEGKVAVLDPTQKKVSTTIDLSERSESMTVGYMAHNVQVAPNGKSVWVTANVMTEEAMGEGHGEEEDEGAEMGRDTPTSAELLDQVIVIDPLTDEIVRRIPIAVDSHLAHVVLSPDSRIAYVTLQEKGAIYAINAVTFTIELKVDLGTNSGPHGARVSPDGSRVFIALMGGKGMGVLDIKTNNVWTYPLGSAVVQTAVTPNGRFVFSSLYETKQIARFDTATQEIVKINLPQEAKGPIQLYSTPDSRFVYVADQGYYFNQPTSDKVYRIDVAPGIVDQTILGGSAPHGVVVDAEGKYGYITNLVSDDVSIIDVKTNTEIARIPVGDMPNGISIWHRTRGGTP